jgi:hypothetical protein
MASTITLANLRTAVRRRADIENSTHVVDAELTDMINSSCQEVYDRLIAARGARFYEGSSVSQTVNSGAATISLPSDFYQLSRVVAVIDGREFLLKRFMDNDVDGSRVPQSSFSIKAYYIPTFTKLSADSDTFDGINGWEECVIEDAAVKCKEKMREDPSIHLARLNQQWKRIDGIKHDRDSKGAARVADVAAGNRPWWSFAVDNLPDLPSYQLRRTDIEFRDIIRGIR